MDMLERKIPPVAVFILFVMVMIRLDQVLLTFTLQLPLTTLVLAVAVILSGVVGIAGVYEFRKAKTTVNPVKVHSATSIVDSGVFAYTRNPMYLALLILLLGIGYWQQNLICLFLPLCFALYMNRFQIRPEERALESLFGAEYLDYKQRVRRWI
ncbi:hypothetical protein VII00023_22049 [Vibrio ichthyoenteri ATCC 700023]|uniref:Isoprenylcysteine carboxyl methyltransferase n=1 Tax=Vibrio ichthyoenteri ATCC 700023 TaxID=870968 RepID=F9S8Y0_9VIBR|nr:isoprenylcysteine carboxylmethyltransferase family protein [Vibrio ichthyoenteri]EGU29147.1 hypothetical protein VII00023_22049 [Vibrio ichthyoenteri ATCC 700023]